MAKKLRRQKILLLAKNKYENENYKKFVAGINSVMVSQDPSPYDFAGLIHPNDIFKHANKGSFWHEVYLDLLDETLTSEQDKFNDMIIKFLKENYHVEKEHLIKNGLIKPDVKKNNIMTIASGIIAAKEKNHCSMINSNDCGRVRAADVFNNTKRFTPKNLALIEAYGKLVCENCENCKQKRHLGR